MTNSPDQTKCFPQSNPQNALHLISCSLPSGITVASPGYNSSGLNVNAYSAHSNTTTPLALKKGGVLSGGAKAGISVGSIVGGLAIIGGAVAFVLFRRRRQGNNTRRVDAERAQQNVVHSNVVHEKRLSDSSGEPR